MRPVSQLTLALGRHGRPQRVAHRGLRQRDSRRVHVVVNAYPDVLGYIYLRRVSARLRRALGDALAAPRYLFGSAPVQAGAVRQLAAEFQHPGAERAEIDGRFRRGTHRQPHALERGRRAFVVNSLAVNQRADDGEIVAHQRQRGHPTDAQHGPRLWPVRAARTYAHYELAAGYVADRAAFHGERQRRAVHHGGDGYARRQPFGDDLGGRLPSLNAQVKRVLPVAFRRPDACVSEPGGLFGYFALLFPVQPQRGVESNSDFHIKPPVSRGRRAAARDSTCQLGALYCPAVRRASVGTLNGGLRAGSSSAWRRARPTGRAGRLSGHPRSPRW